MLDVKTRVVAQLNRLFEMIANYHRPLRRSQLCFHPSIIFLPNYANVEQFTYVC